MFAIETSDKVNKEIQIELGIKMVSASLNWASICGLILLVWTPFIALAGVEKISRNGKPKALWVLIIGRYIFGQLTAGILFFQGWRLDPILQFAQFILVLGIIAESLYSISRDGLPVLGLDKRFEKETQWAIDNGENVPSKGFWVWYIIMLICTVLPLIPGMIGLLAAKRNFKKKEKQLLKLQEIYLHQKNI